MMKNYFGIIAITVLLTGSDNYSGNDLQNSQEQIDSFLIKKSELILTYHHPKPERKLSFSNYQGDFDKWKKETREKFSELIGYNDPGPRVVKLIRTEEIDGIIYNAFIMKVSDDLTIPAYLLEPKGKISGAVMAIHGHGSVEPMIGLRDDYHHKFAYELAKSGFMVLAPELRGFGTLSDLAEQVPIDRLDYWGVSNSHYTLVTDGYLHGQTLIGQTIEDLMAWEEWVFNKFDFRNISVAGISYGGDLALYYPVFSERVSRIFSSGSLGSFTLIFSRCYNAPAHGIPGVLKWIDRSDIAGLNVPRPVLLHYGELDFPSETNASAAFNESVEPSVRELKKIYAQEKAADNVILKISKGKKHEMDIQLLKEFISGN